MAFIFDFSIERKACIGEEEGKAPLIVWGRYAGTISSGQEPLEPWQAQLILQLGEPELH
jgi:hypothetical protein